MRALPGVKRDCVRKNPTQTISRDSDCLGSSHYVDDNDNEVAGANFVLGVVVVCSYILFRHLFNSGMVRRIFDFGTAPFVGVYPLE